MRIDAERNARGLTVISASGSAVEVLVLPADEESAVAQEVLGLLGPNAGPRHGATASRLPDAQLKRADLIDASP